MVSLDEVNVVHGPSKEYLNERQLIDYRHQREQCLKWLLAVGKNPKKADGYAIGTVKSRANRMDYFYRYVWEYEDHYTTQLTHDHAHEWMKDLAYQDYSDVHRDCCQKSVQMLFKWLAHERGGEIWEPEIRFSSSESAAKPRDYLTMSERRAIREASLDYKTVPSYSDLSPEGRDRWRAHLAQRFEKPKSEVVPADWDRANSWKVPSLVFVSLDAGLRPVEVERAVLSWVDLDNGVLRIPKEESAKNNEDWIVGLSSRTVSILRRWLDQREAYAKYDGRDELWLTRQANPYQTSSLKYLLEGLCEVAEIPVENRKMSWYAIRHSTGTYMTREEDLAAAQAQLRHKCAQTTMKYDQAPVEDRKNALDRMG